MGTASVAVSIDALTQILDGSDTEVWHIRPTTEPATLLLSDHSASTQGSLLRAGYKTTDSAEERPGREDFEAFVEVSQS